MNNSVLEVIYKKNQPESHEAGLRGVFEAGFAAALVPAPVVVEEPAVEVTTFETPVSSEAFVDVNIV